MRHPLRKDLFILSVFLLLVPAVALAIVPGEDGDFAKSRPEWIRAPELGAQPSLDYVEAGNPRAAAFRGVGRFLKDYTADWAISWDLRSDRPNLIQGRGVPFLPGAGNDLVWEEMPFQNAGGVRLSDVAELARAFLDVYPELFELDPDTLVLDERESGNFGRDGQLWFVTFQQTYEGIPVEGARVFFRVNHGNLVSFGSENVADVNVNTQANVDAAEALKRVLDYVGAGAEEVTEVLSDGVLKIVATLPPGEARGLAYQGAPGGGYRHSLVREVSFRRAGDDATYQALVDARSGRILELVDANDYATVKGGVLPESTLDTEVVLTFPSNVATTAGPCTSLNGTHFNMNDNCGANDICDSNDASTGNGIVDLGTNSGDDCSTPGFGGAGNTKSSRSGMYHLSTIRNTAKGFHPTNTWLDTNVTANMNINNTCNAYWNGSTLNFYRSGGGCGNTGEIAAVFLHEWGHGFDTNTGGAASDKASGEAVGDIFASIYLQSSCIGRGFYQSGVCYNCTTCTGVRDLQDFSLAGTKPIASPANVTNNSGINCDRYTCPYTGYAGPMGYEGHCESYIASTAVWDLKNLIGYPATEEIWYDSLVPSKSAYQVTAGGQCNASATVNGCGATNWYTVFLDVDDDDGNLANGTPNGCHIWDAMSAHGIACGSRPACSGGAGSCTNQVPFMTGTTTPSGTVTSSGNYSSTYADWKAFDASDTTMWISEVNETPAWIAYDWGSPRYINRYSLTFKNGSLTTRAPKDWTFQGWNGSSWVTLDTRTGETGWAGSETRSYNVASPGNYAKYRLYVTDDNDSRTGVVVISLGRIALETCNCASATNQVPFMTSTTTPSGTVTSSGNYSSTYADWKAFDASDTTMWISEVNETPAWIAYDWGSPRFIERYSLTFKNGSLTTRAPKDWTFQGWNGSSWVTLDTRTGETGWAGSETRSYTVATPGVYNKYRLNFTDDNDSRTGVVVISLGRIALEGCSM